MTSSPDPILIAEQILAAFTKTPDGYRARVGQAQIAKWRDQLDQAARVLTAEGSGPLLDPDCRDGKHTSCVGEPCECECHKTLLEVVDAGGTP